jgi:Zn-dependent M28 family amino/carboxypeptidase
LLHNSEETISILCAEIDHGLKPHSFELARHQTADLNAKLQEEKQTVHNVTGYLPGGTSEYEVIGAHYDHLGLGEQDSLAPSQLGTVHPGADDNRWVSGVIELARHFTVRTDRKRGMLFTCFTGEEEGLLGSEYMADHLPLRSSETVAMINLDMIGRLRGGTVYVGGTGTGLGFNALVQQAGSHVGLNNDLSESGVYGASDHTSFTAKRIPTLFFFTGLHSDYHKPSDTWEKINAAGARRCFEKSRKWQRQLRTRHHVQPLATRKRYRTPVAFPSAVGLDRAPTSAAFPILDTLKQASNLPIYARGPGRKGWFKGRGHIG